MLEAKKLSKQEERYTYSTASGTCDNEPQIAVESGKYQRIQEYTHAKHRNINKVNEVRRFRTPLKDLHVRIDYNVVRSVKKRTDSSKQNSVYTE